MLKAGIFHVDTKWSIPHCVLIVPMHETIDEYDIKLKLGKYGKVADIDIREVEGGKKPRRALVKFAYPPSAKACSKFLNGKVWRGQKTMVYTMDFWRLREEIDKTNATMSSMKLFVSNIPHSVTKFQLQSYFQKFGPLNMEQTTVKTDRRRQRIAFITFNSTECLEIALRSSPHFINGGFLQVSRMTHNDTPFLTGTLQPGQEPPQVLSTLFKNGKNPDPEQSTTNESQPPTGVEGDSNNTSTNFNQVEVKEDPETEPSLPKRRREESNEQQRSSRKKLRSRSRSPSPSSSDDDSSSSSESQSDSESLSNSPAAKHTELPAEDAAEYHKELEEELQLIKEREADVDLARQRRRARWKSRKLKT